MIFTDPQGRTIEVNSPDGSIPTEAELDQMFSQKYGAKAIQMASQDPVIQRTGELFRSLPFMRGIASRMTGKPLASIDRTLDMVGNAPDDLASALSRALPQVAMASPFFRVAGALGSVPPVLRTAGAMGAFEGTKAASQNRPVGPAAAQGAFTGAVFHGLGRAGATAARPLSPAIGPNLANRLGSAVGGGVAGAATSPQDMKTGAVFGATMGAAFPSKPLQNDKLAGRLNNSLIKGRGFDKSLLIGNPGEGIAKEAIVSRTIEGLGEKVSQRLDVLNKHLDDYYMANNTKLASYQQPIMRLVAARNQLAKNPATNEAAITRLDKILSDLTGLSRGTQRKFNNLTPNEARKLKQDIADFTDWTLEGRADKLINKALKDAYSSVDTILDGIVPQARELNKRVSNLISAEKAINLKVRQLQTADPMPGFFSMVDMPFRAMRQPGFKTGLASALAEHYGPVGPPIPSGPLPTLPTQGGIALPSPNRPGLPSPQTVGRMPYQPPGQQPQWQDQMMRNIPYPRQYPTGQPVTEAQIVRPSAMAEDASRKQQFMASLEPAKRARMLKLKLDLQKFNDVQNQRRELVGKPTKEFGFVNSGLHEFIGTLKMEDIPKRSIGTPEYRDQRQIKAGRKVSKPIVAIVKDINNPSSPIEIVDGWHRYRQALANGDKTIPVKFLYYPKGKK